MNHCIPNSYSSSKTKKTNKISSKKTKNDPSQKMILLQYSQLLTTIQFCVKAVRTKCSLSSVKSKQNIKTNQNKQTKTKQLLVTTTYILLHTTIVLNTFQRL